MNTKETYLIILCGQAFSGKSTLSKKLSEFYNAKIIGRDAVYFTLEELLAFENTPDEDDPSLWKNLWPIAIQGIKNQLLTGTSVIFDDTCLFFSQREELRIIAEQAGIKSVLVYLDIPVEIRKARKEENKITKHRHDVPSGWLDNDEKKFERPTDIENPIIYKNEEDFGGIIEKVNNL